ncbi:hypothetical protein K490DRAFT_68721 [Saccharata proteae CBS 121410]|uniref:Vegetative cell wall protein gp1 n=1 Tax=Saccharata proteae CBS 121410 TaxID=1314787 RepID=A0A9P4HML7_9PEZI|nr:hypothetical protein K490DRAFT_68721 [Saccharata proteae CBS 121410]
MPYDYIRTPPMSPSPGTHGYYSPRYSVHTATPSPRGSPKHHARRASQQDPPIYTYSTRMPGYAYSSPRYPSQHQTTPRAGAYDYVSGTPRAQPRPGRSTRPPPDGEPCRKHCSCKYCHCGSGNTNSKNTTPNSTRFYQNVVVDDGYGDEDDFAYRSPPPPYEPYQTHRETYRFSYQVPVYGEAETTPTANRTRPRRSSHSSRPQPSPPQQKRPSAAKPPPKATDEDARRAGIPAGYSYKNWDPSEEPIMLLGSVFDANSLGKWIYDWTVFHYGPATPMSEMAGELWLLLIQLAGKVKRAEDCMHKIRKQENRELVEDFLESGERLWHRFGKLLKACEDYMWRAAKRESGEKKPVQMGRESGCEFVDAIFGRDRELEKTEKLMTGIRLWGMRFDANCEEVLRYPSR